MFVGSAPGQADEGFRCPRTKRLVNVGDRMGEVGTKCGRADFADSHVEKRSVKHRIRNPERQFDDRLTEEREIEVVVDDWTYDFGRRALIRYLRFENGMLIDVTTGPFGSDD
jgi:ribosomal protein L2